MSEHPQTRTSAVLQGVVAGFTRNNILGALQHSQKLDIEREKARQLQENVREFTLSIGSDKNNQKVFQALRKRNPGFARNADSFREFVSTFFKTRMNDQGITDAVNAGIITNNPAVVKALRNSNIDDSEAMGKLLVQQGWRNTPLNSRTRKRELKQRELVR